ncbi:MULTISPECIES: glycosyl hydrolase [Paenibacillus]|uniref:Mannan endo-1,4-beta-mannosidase n=1 Tax=Paenibacillus pabuli TaxID=1472 RepID=A0A855Y542_9BACL|nr:MULTISPECIES: glycosyl hydrolase [Paenibacillus]PWW36124.1 mannan endo-1,4-beta-mannosidase [Paenibacillus pabuli]PXW03203.1 mannan endo-1,4-beta-mannosidase [Paenibacillus taichungensis]RAI98107.1 mannan endo-1,4-beta-mannosidase [Paenibacillus pabuli]
MKILLKKTGVLMLALTLLLGLMTVPVHADSPLFTIESENALLSSDLQVTTEIYGQSKPGFSGSGFVWMQNSGTITFTVTVPETGMYAISTRYMQELSADGRLQYLSVNGVTKGSYMLPYTTTWSDFNFGYQKLNQGSNTIQLKAGWGFAYFDTFTVDYANLDPLDVQPVLTDSQATPETQLLMNYLTEVYGNHIISGQQEIYGGGNDGNTELEFDWIHNLTGKYPAIRGFDFMNYNPLYGWEDGTTDRMIDWVNNRDGIATASWHINVPRNFTTYQLGDHVDWKEATYKPTETNFNTANAVIPGTKEYQYVMSTIDDLAEQLLILQDNNVPVLFRPYHEAEGNGGLNGEGAWFWWASAGADVYKQLWDMLYTELTETYGLHNLIWTYNSYVYNTSPAWYPGDDQVDIVGYDKYNTIYNRTDGLSGVPNEDAITSIFYQLVDLTGGKKMVAMTENDTVPSVQNLTEEKSGWLYFCPWYGEHLMSSAFNYPATLKTLYQSDYVITLDELPNLKVNNPTSNASLTPTTVEFDKHTPNPSDKAITVNFNGNTLTGLRIGTSALTANQDYTLSGSTLLLKKEFLAGLPVGEHSIVFDFNQGQDPVLKVKIVDSTPSTSAVISPVNAAFDKAANLAQDVSLTLTLNGRQLTSITNGNYTLVSGQDYTASSNAIILRKSYLSTLPLSQNTITFHFNGGNNAVLTVNVVDSSVSAPSGGLTIQAFNGNTSVSTNGVSPKFKVVNTGNSAIQLSDVKLRYYYTIDGEEAQSFWSDWASIGSANVTSKFVKLATPVAGADYALEVGFTSSAGTLNAGQSAEIQARFSKNNWSNYNQANDYSFKASSTQFANNEQVTGYINGQLAWGIEP